MQYTQLFRQLRERKGLTHDALARLARCHRNTVLNVEGGRRVRFQTIARLTTRMGYASDSPEMAALALAWLEALTGIDLADPSKMGAALQKTAVYTRSSGQAAARLTDAVRRAGLGETDIRLLIFAAKNPEVLRIVRSIHELVQEGAVDDDRPGLMVAEDR